MTLTYPDDCLQSFCTWWAGEQTNNDLRRGRLLRAFVPYFDQQPLRLEPLGRTDPTDHTKAHYRTVPFSIGSPQKQTELPVSAFPTYAGESRVVYRGKKRPVLVISARGTAVPANLRIGAAKWQTHPTVLVAPYFGVDRDGERGGWNPEFIKRIRRCEYPQYIWDKLPLSTTTEESVLRIDQTQPLGCAAACYEWTPHCLSEEALALLDEYISWFISGRMDEGGALYSLRQGLIDWS